LYVLTAWGVSCLAVAYQPLTPLLFGALGALCGILAAEVVWVVLNRRYLPPSWVRRWRLGMMFTVVLLVAVSLGQGVSGWGHLVVGTVVGGLAALLLHVQRFGPAPMRWLALAALLTLPGLSFLALERQRAVSPQWHEAEQRE